MDRNTYLAQVVMLILGIVLYVTVLPNALLGLALVAAAILITLNFTADAIGRWLKNWSKRQETSDTIHLDTDRTK